MKSNDLKFTPSNQLSIHKSKKRAKLRSVAVSFFDPESNQHLYYLPALHISAHGSTLQSAMEMLQNTVNEYFEWLLSLPKKAILEELKNLGWKQDAIQSKRFSNSFVDANGVLQEIYKDGPGKDVRNLQHLSVSLEY